MIISDNCRGNRDDLVTLVIALEELKKEVLLSLAGYKRGEKTKFHIIASVEINNVI